MEIGPTDVDVVAVTTDLLARARLEDAAARAGSRLEIASVTSLQERLAVVRPSVLILDLDAGREALLETVRSARAAGVVPARVVGFFSHVDKELGAAAVAAGCEAFPRGKFWRGLEALLSGEATSGPS